MSAPHRFRQPADTVLHRAVCKGIPQFFAAAAATDRDVPKFVERELNGYRTCGQLEHGFAKIECGACSHVYVVGFSCKGRGFCPSCCGRRMADVSLHLVENVLTQCTSWIASEC